MDEIQAGPAPNGYQDRRAGLIVFGILEIGIGGLCAVLLALLVLLKILAPETIGDLDPFALAAAALIYLATAVIFTWLGIGSILCRRWAQTLLLILAWSWLLCGVIAIGFLVWLMRAFPSEGTSDLLWVIALIATGILGIALPGAMAAFYQSKDVRATCAARDPAPRWTDQCPLPVLTNALWLGLGALWLIAAAAMKQSVVPVFGYLVTGTPAALILLICAAAGLYLAYATYRLQMAGWWGSLAAFGLFALSGSITFALVDPAEFYRKSGYPEDQIALIGRLPFFTGKALAWINAAFFVLFLIYLLWIRKFFIKPAGSRG
jgi:MFS family permease